MQHFQSKVINRCVSSEPNRPRELRPMWDLSAALLVQTTPLPGGQGVALAPDLALPSVCCC